MPALRLAASAAFLAALPAFLVLAPALASAASEAAEAAPLAARWLAEYRTSPPHGTGAALEDSDILAEINSRFRGDPRLEESAIDIRCHEGAVSLEGNALTAEARQAAEEIVTQVDGVTRVDNRISVPADGRLLYPPRPPR